jgi:hypothetical protein
MSPEDPATTTRPVVSGKRRLEGDLDARERGRDGASGLRLVGDAREVLRRDARDDRVDVEVGAGDARAGMKVTDAVVSTLSGGVPLPARACDSAIEKHDECAAAMSSSGVVTDVEPSLRAFQLTASGPWFELSRATSPEPS